MSRKGGYKIIDLQGYDFNSSMVIEGIHERIESSYDKTLLFTGIVIDGVEKNDVFATPSVNGDGYDVTLYGLVLHINNIDVVSISRVMTLIQEINDPSQAQVFIKENDVVYVQVGNRYYCYSFITKLPKDRKITYWGYNGDHGATTSTLELISIDISRGAPNTFYFTPKNFSSDSFPIIYVYKY